VKSHTPYPENTILQNLKQSENCLDKRRNNIKRNVLKIQIQNIVILV